ncbi:tetratricopeptide repeat protein [Nevskia soli]|jgi:TPR repeat protein|uniref:tetratricopeptide repeat protein n=1 Tax=Nevskia soli TaxID=418856 RepID=UPI0015D751E0|nr:tetratricopeptide repeat protein [Nevskia soli]
MKRSTLAIVLITSGFSVTCFAADFNVGMQCYNSGDFGCASREWQGLADKGVGQAQYNLALLYSRGQGTDRDLVKAAQLLESAANQGLVQAQYNLGLAYLAGLGVEKNENTAISWFQKAAELGDPNAADNLGTILEKQKDYENAMKWYRKAADAGIAEADFNIGSMYDLGKGVQQDPVQAMQWYRKGADLGDGASLCNIAILYYNGEGVKMDRAKAYEYLLIAQQAGEPRAASLMQWVDDKVQKKDKDRAMQQAQAWISSHPLHRFISNFSAPDAIIEADSKVEPQPVRAGL